MNEEIEVSVFYETWDGKVRTHKESRSKFDVGPFADDVIANGFRRVDEAGFVHQIPPSMIREVVWMDV